MNNKLGCGSLLKWDKGNACRLESSNLTKEIGAVGNIHSTCPHPRPHIPIWGCDPFELWSFNTVQETCPLDILDLYINLPAILYTCWVTNRWESLCRLPAFDLPIAPDVPHLHSHTTTVSDATRQADIQ